MANILYYTREKFIQSAFAGGMKTKTLAIEEAWRSEGLHTVEVSASLEDALAYDVVIVELLALNDFDVLDERLEILSECNQVLIYGSDSELLRWEGKHIKRLQAAPIKWIANCHWQANYFQDFDLPVIGVVREPVNCDLFRPNTPVKPWILAGGNVSYEKQSDFFIELFGRLQAMETHKYQTGYIGDANTWGSPKVLDLRLAKDLEGVVDVFHGTVPSSTVATILGSGAIFIVNSLYETCNRMGMEAHAAGLLVAGGPHICFDEWPHAVRFTTLDDCIECLAEATSGFRKLPPTQIRQASRTWAESEFSYAASLAQLNNLLRRL